MNKIIKIFWTILIPIWIFPYILFMALFGNHIDKEDKEDIRILTHGDFQQ